ncbi:MAG: fasciclin domain-containing protein [Bacteroidota bacterium]
MKQVNFFFSRLLLLVAVVGFTLSLKAQTIYDVVANSTDHNTLEAAIDAAQLRTALENPNASLTLFAPTDAAFAALGDLVNDLVNNNPTGQLADILRYHLLNGPAASEFIDNGDIITPANMANTLKFTRRSADDTLFVNQAKITVLDIAATNGVVHVIDAVILPNETVVDVAIDNGFNTLTDAVVAAELLPALTDPNGTYTVFAPTDDAFAALGDVVNTLLQDPTGDLQNILLYHVLGAEVAAADVASGVVQPLSMTNTLKLTKRSADDTIFVNQAQVALADIDGGNGTVHVIDAVVLPGETVADVAIDNGFNTLVAAVTAAELLPALTDPAGSYTVFAPTEDAFGALGDAVNTLLQDPTGDLQDILLYHVLGTEVAAADVASGVVQPLSMTNTLKLTKRSADDTIFVNQAQVALADLDGGNGTVHVIDAVVLPGETVVDVAIDNGFSTLATAVTAAELLPALTDPAGSYTVFAPTEDAFGALGDVVNTLLQDPTGDLQDILLYHVLGTEVASGDVASGVVQPLSMTNSLKLTKRSADDTIFVNQAQVALADLDGGNGTVHVIDAVVLPGETVADVAIDNGFNTLVAAVTAAELLPALTDPAGSYTVFAPTEDAFGALGDVVNTLLQDPTGDLQDILLYHVLGTEVASGDVASGVVQPLSMTNTLKLTKRSADDTIFVNQAQVALADLDGGNGTVHVIDAVVLPGETVADVAIDNGFNTLVAAVTAAELLPALTDPAGSYTVFAPADSAFAALGTTVDDLLLDPTGDLQDILLYHVLGMETPSDSVETGVVQPLSMTNTLKLTKTLADSTIFVNQARVTLEDVMAGNGVVHAIDAVVLPVETVVDIAIDNNFMLLNIAASAAELFPALTDPAGTYTVFAPTNSAFTALGSTVNDLLLDPTGDLQDILLYHVLGDTVAAANVTNGAIVQPLSMTNTLKLTKTSADGTIFVNQAQVTDGDFRASNGIVHVLDAVVLPVETVVDIAIDNDDFNTLTTAVVAAELLPALTNPAGTFTVFAPTDSAFTALGDTINDLLADPTGNLANTLLYHVLGSVVTSDMLTMDGQIVETLFPGNVLSVDLSDGIKINDSQVILPDLAAANGVVHVINRVLTPDFPTSTRELQLTPLQVFPNPTTDYININAVEQDYQYSIFDVTGAILQNGNLLQGSNYIRLNNLSNGTYFMRVFNDEAFKTVRLVVNR